MISRMFRCAWIESNHLVYQSMAMAPKVLHVYRREAGFDVAPQSCHAAAGSLGVASLCCKLFSILLGLGEGRDNLKA